MPVAVIEYLVKSRRKQKKFKKQDDEERLNNWKRGQQFIVNTSGKQNANARSTFRSGKEK